MTGSVLKSNLTRYWILTYPPWLSSKTHLCFGGHKPRSHLQIISRNRKSLQHDWGTSVYESHRKCLHLSSTSFQDWLKEVLFHHLNHRCWWFCKISDSCKRILVLGMIRNRNKLKFWMEHWWTCTALKLAWKTDRSSEMQAKLKNIAISLFPFYEKLCLCLPQLFPLFLVAGGPMAQSLVRMVSEVRCFWLFLTTPVFIAYIYLFCQIPFFQEFAISRPWTTMHKQSRSCNSGQLDVRMFASRDQI